ncbi:hypothetical protein GQ457_03G013860 [Hibiscus cannabinus]
MLCCRYALPLITKRLESVKITQKPRNTVVIKWMLSKGQGRTMGTYFTLLNALAEDGRLEEAEELWTKLFSDNLESTPRIFFDKMMSVYYHKDMHEKMFEVFADMEELGVKPSISVASMVGNVFQKLGMLDKYDKLKKKYPPPKWEYRYIKGKRVRIQVKQLQEFDKTANGITEDKETEEISSLEHEEVEAGSNKVKQLQELEKIANGVTEDNETKKNSSLEHEEASSNSVKQLQELDKIQRCH